MFRSILASASLAALSACATVPLEGTTHPLEQDAATPHERLHKLFAEANEATLDLNPMSALYRGDLRNADRLTDSLRPAYYQRSRTNAQQQLAQLSAIDYAALNPTDRLAYDVFKFNLEKSLRDLDPEWLALTRVRPLDHFRGLHNSYPNFAGPQGPAPYETVEDYENAAKRHADYARYIDRAIAAFREGLASGVVESRLTVSNMIEQLDTQLAIPATESPIYAPAKAFPATIPQAEQERLARAIEQAIEDEVYPANRRLRDFLRDEYLPHARTEPGLSKMKGGAAVYREAIRENTTLDLGADAVHRLGLSEVERIHGEIRKVMRETGFDGTLAEFFVFMRSDPRFRPPSKEWMIERYERIGREVDGKIGAYFSHLPKTPLEIRPYEPYRERYQAGASYQSGAPDGSRPGIFYFNTYDLDSRSIVGMNTLYLHEAVPGHHFQISLARENAALPDFLRFGGYTVFNEGWALYAETLGYPMGLFDDPYQRYGTLSDELFRAMRLVVDTGIHAKGWSRDRAIDYMLANSSMGRTEIENEVDRYIAWPGQALAYKIGALKILELRERAEQALGPRFDIRAYHAQVLDSGSLPLPVLEQKIDRWIAASLAGN